MSSSSASAGWYENIAVYSSDYVPATFDAGNSVQLNHDLLGGLRDNEFETTNQGYTLGLLTLFLVFIVSGVLACFLLPCLYQLLGTSRQERLRKRMEFGRSHHVGGNLVMVLGSVVAVATAIGAVWGLARADSGLTTIESKTQEVATDLLSLLSLPNDTTVALDRISSTYTLLGDSVSGCGDTAAVLQPLLDQFDLGSLADSVQSEIDDLNAESLDQLASDVQGISDAVAQTEGARKGVVWPILVLALAFTILFVLFGVSTYECVAFGLSDCGAVTCCVSPCTIFIAVVVWLCAASAVTLSALTGDYCIDPDNNTNELITQNSSGEQLTQLITYYTTDCTTQNDAVDAVLAAQEVAVPIIQGIVPVLYSLVDQCSNLLAPVRGVDDALRALWTVLSDAAELSSCENLNGLYQTAVYNELCKDLPRGLLGFWVSSSLLTVLLLILVVQWNRMLRQQTTESDAEAVEAMNRHRASRLKVFSKRYAENLRFSGLSARFGSRDPTKSEVAPPQPTAPSWAGSASLGPSHNAGSARAERSNAQRAVALDGPLRA